MTVFRQYADFYDSLYEDKDYKKECEFVRSILAKYARREIDSILDLGCGTGSHAFFFADMGYKVTGVDFSEDMLKIAREKAAQQQKYISFLQQDIRHLNLNQEFDAAVAMFAVMSYQATNRDFEEALISVYRHLITDGLFIFDVWFEPAVLGQKPEDRTKTIEYAGEKIVRHAHPVLDIKNQTVQVNYRVVKEASAGKPPVTLEESHLMRFFGYQELKYLLEKNGFEMMRACPFLDLDGEVGEDSWNISAICRRV